jgi:hypothetical protein
LEAFLKFIIPESRGFVMRTMGGRRVGSPWKRNLYTVAPVPERTRKVRSRYWPLIKMNPGEPATGKGLISQRRTAS